MFISEKNPKNLPKPSKLAPMTVPVPTSISFFFVICEDYPDDDLSDYSERPELTQFDSKRPPRPDQAPEFKPEISPEVRPELSPENPSLLPNLEEEDEDLILPEVTEATKVYELIRKIICWR